MRSFFVRSHLAVKIMSPYYAVAKGRNPGIYNTWDECKQQVHKSVGAVFKKFPTLKEAEQFIKERGSSTFSSSNSSTPNKVANTRYTSYERPGLVQTLENKWYRQIDKINELHVPKRKLSTDIENNLPANTSTKKQRTKDTEINRNKIEPRSCYDNQEVNKDEDGYVNVFTDGACTANGNKNAKAGIGVWFADDHPLNVSQPVVGRATNNMAEIQAVTVAVTQAKKAGIEKLKINTDSQFLINCITKWMKGWKRNGWKTSSGKPVINKEELLEMEKALESIDVTWNHVRGHVGIHGNEMADKLAREGSLAYKST